MLALSLSRLYRIDQLRGCFRIKLMFGFGFLGLTDHELGEKKISENVWNGPLNFHEQSNSYYYFGKKWKRTNDGENDDDDYYDDDEWWYHPCSSVPAPRDHSLY